MACKAVPLVASPKEAPYMRKHPKQVKLIKLSAQSSPALCWPAFGGRACLPLCSATWKQA